MAVRKKGGKGGAAKTKRRSPKAQPNDAKGESSALSSTASLHQRISLAVVLLAAAWQLARRKDGGRGVTIDSPDEASGDIQFDGAAAYQRTSDPWVDVIPDVIPPSVCDEVIARSERIGYRLHPDSIDAGDAQNHDQLAQEIYLFHNKRVVEPNLYSLVEPHLSKLSAVIKRRRPYVSDEFANHHSFTNPKIAWIFLRKYAPGSKRKSLKTHTDSNMHSVTLALNDDFIGGGLFVVRPRNISDSGRGSSPSVIDVNFRFPEIPREYGSYQWMHEQDDLVRQRNTSKVFFPDLPQGSAAMINFTVPHGVAPLADDTPVPRYALIIFYNREDYFDKVDGHRLQNARG